MMSCAELIGLAKSLEWRVGRRQGKGGLRWACLPRTLACAWRASRHRRQASLNPDERLWNLGLEWMRLPVESKQPSEVFRSNRLKLGFPAERCG